MSLEVTITPPNIPGGLLNFNQINIEEAIVGVNKSTTELRRADVKASPKAFGDMKRAWQNEPAKYDGVNVTGRVIISGRPGMAALVEDKGAKPHSPPISNNIKDDPIKRWVRRKLGLRRKSQINKVAFAVRKKAKEGRLGGKRTFTKVFEALLPKFTSNLKNSMNKAKRRIEGRS